MQEESPDFSISDVFSDAFVSVKNRIGTHIGFNVLYLLTAVLGYCIFACVMYALMMVMGLGMYATTSGSSQDPAAMAGAMGLFGIVVYGVFFVVVIFYMSVHHAFSLDVTIKDLRNEPVDLSTGLSAAFSRLVPQAGFSFVKMCIDWSVGCIVSIAIFAIAGSLGSSMDFTPGASPWRVLSTLLPFYLVSYVIILGWVAAVRGFIGLAAATVQAESIGPIAAIGRSAALLSGQRMRFIGVRVLWFVTGLFVTVLLYVPVAAVAYSAVSGGEPPNPALFLLAIPYSMFIFAVFILMYSFDSALEGAYYARRVPKHTQTNMAEVFG